MTIHLMAMIAVLTTSGADTGNRPEPAETQALRFLAVEVPRWSRENHCYSCHNNGDAARSLFLADRLFGNVPADSLADTITWLKHPGDWDKNGGRGAPTDKRLARVQFTASLAGAIESGKAADRALLLQAAERLAEDQSEDGSWPIEGGAATLIGSPATYGSPLATATARDVLRLADRERFRGPIQRAEHWLIARPIRNLLDASTALMALDGSSTPPTVAERIRRQSLELIVAGESQSGGWGPYVNASPEPFDTAVVLLALSRTSWDPKVAALIHRGRSWLIASQRPDGSWPETTRPSGGESYAQRLSTAGWALRALLVTRTIADDH